MRVVLIGGTSKTGKPAVAEAVAERLGFEHRSTDGLARHAGDRPFVTDEETRDLGGPVTREEVRRARTENAEEAAGAQGEA